MTTFLYIDTTPHIFLLHLVAGHKPQDIQDPSEYLKWLKFLSVFANKWEAPTNSYSRIFKILNVDSIFLQMKFTLL